MAVSKAVFVDNPSTNVFVNQGVEASLLERVSAGETVLYVWTNDFAVVIGRNQNAYAECKVELLESDGGLLARRLSGGGAVFHDNDNLNFTFISKSSDFDKERNFNVVQRAVESFGICVERNGRNDLTVIGAKFSGNAYYTKGDCKLHHGTLLLGTSKERVAKYLTPDQDKFTGKAVKSVSSRVCALDTYNSEINRESMVAALEKAFAEEYAEAEFCRLAPFMFGADIVLKWTGFFGADEWRYGKKEDFDFRMKTELFGRPAVVALRIENDEIKSARIYTDALESEKVCAVEETLCGVNLKAAAEGRIVRSGTEENGIHVEADKTENGVEDCSETTSAACAIASEAAKEWYEN